MTTAEFDGTGEVEPRDYCSKDLENWRQVTAQLKEQELAQTLTAAPPEGYWHEANIPWDPLDLSYIKEKVLKQQGFNKVMVGPLPSPVGIWPDGEVSVYVPDDIELDYNYVITMLETFNKDPLMRILKLADQGLMAPESIEPDYLRPGGVYSIGEYQELIERGLMQRAYLTSELRAEDNYREQVRNEFRGGKLLSEEFYRRTVYNQLREAGFPPFGPEEMYGITTSYIRNILDKHPELRPAGPERD